MEASLTYSLFLVIMVCSADNELQQGSKSRTEDFMPRIIEHPSDLVVRRDQPGIVNCRAEGNPEPTIEWHRNGESVNFSKGHNSLIPGGSLFFLHFKGRSDEGVYTCLARNHLGTAVSRNASLTIAVLKDEFRQEPLDKVVIAGRPLVIDCSPPKGYPEPVVTWRKNGALLHRNNTRYMFAAGRLSIARALSSDAGVYMCVASNQADERTSRGAVISVLEIPQFTNKPADVVAKLGSTVQFACGAQGNPKPIVQWSKEKGVLPTGRYAITNENTLCLQRVTVQDSGTYVCTARSNIGAVSASAQLMVQDPLDTGQILQELSKVKLYLDSVTLHNSSSVRIQWKAYSSSQYTEGYTLLYRLHTTSDSDWEKWGVIPVNENTAVISGLHKGQKYEFKVRPYGWNVYGMDSNIRHVLIPEDVPGPAPQDVNITLANGRNGSIIVNWEPPPPQGGHGGYIKAYKVWCIGNETLPQSNWTVDSGTRSLEIPLLPAGIKYQVQVAALYDSGMGKLSNPQYILIETPMMKENTPDGMIPLDLLLQVIKHPAFIATMGGATWLMLMVAVIYLCQRNSKRYSKKKHSGLYRFASEDTIIKHRMDTSDSPWLSNTWRSASCSRNYSSTTSMDSHLLWMENKDTTDFHKSTISFERKSEGSRSQIIPLVPDSSMYGALHVDLPGKDLTTFQCPSPVRPPGMGISSKSGIHLGLYDHNLFPHCHGSVNNLTPGGARSKIPGKPVVLVPPNVAIKEPRRHNLKRELHHVNSAPLSHFVQTDSGSVPSVKSLDGNPPGKGEYAKVMKTFSSPKILHYTTSLKVMDILPYSNPLPPPPAPPPEEEPSRDGLDKPVPKMMTDPQQDNGHKPTHFSKKKSPPDSLLFRQMSSLSIHDDTVLTPEDIAHYLEFNGQGDHTRRTSESDSTLPLPFSTSSNTYGYICSPSELAEVDAADEDDDLDLGELSSLKSYRKYCETPTSSISEYESSMAGSLVNGWGSVSEDNYTSARCSMVSSSDGSFLMDASFAKALAVAVDSFCLGITQSESVGVDRISSDFSPSASPLDGLLAAQNQGDGTDLNSRKPKVNPLPVLDWNIDWMDELEAKYRHRSQTKPQYPFSKKVEPFK